MADFKERLKFELTKEEGEYFFAGSSSESEDERESDDDDHRDNYDELDGEEESSSSEDEQPPEVTNGGGDKLSRIRNRLKTLYQELSVENEDVTALLPFHISQMASLVDASDVFTPCGTCGDSHVMTTTRHKFMMKKILKHRKKKKDKLKKDKVKKNKLFKRKSQGGGGDDDDIATFTENKVDVDDDACFRNPPPRGARLLLEGASGSGKSTFLVQVARSWCGDPRGFVSETWKKNVEDRFLLAFLVKPGSDVIDILSELSEAMTAGGDDGFAHLEEADILIMIDDVHRMDKTLRETTFVQRLINGKLFPGSTVVMTSIPDYFTNNNADDETDEILTKCFDKKFRIQGVQLKDILNSLSAIPSDQLEDIIRNKLIHLFDIRYLECPSLVTLICKVLCNSINNSFFNGELERCPLPDTKTDIYKLIMGHVFQNDNWQKDPKCVKIVSGLGELAVNTIYNTGEKTENSENYQKPEEGSDAITYSLQDIISACNDRHNSETDQLVQAVVQQLFRRDSDEIPGFELLDDVFKFRQNINISDDERNSSDDNDVNDVSQQVDIHYKPIQTSILEFAAAFHLVRLESKESREHGRDKNRKKITESFLQFLPTETTKPQTHVSENNSSLLFPFVFDLLGATRGLKLLSNFSFMYSNWFESHYMPLALERDVFVRNVKLFKPFLPSAWNVSTTDGGSHFSHSELYPALTQFGITSESFAKISVSSDPSANHNLPNRDNDEDGNDNKTLLCSLTLNVFGGDPMSPDANDFCTWHETEHFRVILRKPKTTSPHEQKKKNHEQKKPKVDNLKVLFRLIQSGIRCRNLSIINLGFMDSCDFLPVLHEESMGGELMNVQFRSIECALNKDKKTGLKLLGDLIQFEKIHSLKIKIPSSTITEQHENDEYKTVNKRKTSVEGLTHEDCGEQTTGGKNKTTNFMDKLTRKIPLLKRSNNPGLTDYVSFDAWKCFFQRASDSHLLTELSIKNQHVQSSCFRVVLNELCKRGRKSWKSIELIGDVEVEIMGDEEDNLLPTTNSDSGSAVNYFDQQQEQQLLDVDYLRVDSIRNFWEDVTNIRVHSLYFGRRSFSSLNVTADHPTLACIRELRLSLPACNSDNTMLNIMVEDGFEQLSMLPSLETLSLDIAVVQARNATVECEDDDHENDEQDAEDNGDDRYFQNWIKQILQVIERSSRLRRFELNDIHVNFDFVVKLTHSLATWLMDTGLPKRHTVNTATQIPLALLVFRGRGDPVVSIPQLLSILNEVRTPLALYLINRLEFEYPVINHGNSAVKANSQRQGLCQLLETFPARKFDIERNSVLDDDDDESPPWARSSGADYDHDDHEYQYDTFSIIPRKR